MRRTLIIIALSLLILTLAVRALLVFQGKSEDDRAMFLDHLEYNFSARIDSVITFSNRKDLVFVTFDSVAGKFDPRHERDLNSRLKYRTMTCISRSGAGYKMYIHTSSALAGDSLFVDSRADHLRVVRHGEVIHEARLSNSAYGKPWK